MSSTECNPRTNYKHPEGLDLKAENPVFSGLPSDPTYNITRYMDDRSARVADIGFAESDSYKKNKQADSMKKRIDKLVEIAVRGLDDKASSTITKFPYPTDIHVSSQSKSGQQCIDKISICGAGFPEDEDN